ncbi:MAG TPA: BTAD domain-containing putative transcriptional regulator, partial [Kutzneria sp.]
MLLVTLLGALQAEVDGRELELGPPKQRALFAQLAVRRNQVVSRTELVDGVWGEEPPESVRGIIHTYVSKLRQTLAGDRKATARESVLASVGSGYRLALEPQNLDVWRFEHAFQQAGQARTANDVERAIAHWDEGLKLWQGAPLPGVPGPFAESQRQHLEELRLAAIEDRAETLLSLGRESEVVVDLRTTVEDNPLRERLRALHMIALYRGGRQAEALEHHDRLRRLLAAELGVDPGSEVQDVYQQILANDPALGRPTLVHATPRVTVTLPKEEPTTPTREGRSPYPGLLAFSVGNAQYFFGREQLTATLVDRLGDPRRDGPVAVVGASGSGKSSLLRAGLVPTIEGMDLATPRRWAWLLLTPGNKPVEALASSLAQATGRPPSELLALMQDDPTELAGLLDGTDRLVVVVDQFEELFTLCEDEAQRRIFVSALTALNAAVVYGVRADFYGHCARFPELLASLERAVVVGPMTAAALRETIERPAALAGLELEPGLSDLLLRDLGAEEDTGGVLPLLAHALLATWQVREGNRLTLQGYAEVGGIHRAIATTADATYARFDPGGRDLVRRLLLRMVHVGEGVEVTRARVDRASLIDGAADPETAAAVLDALARARLVTLDENTAEISHEALLRSWPRLRQWVADNREGLRLHQQLAQDARSWHRDGRDDSGLYRGAKLAIALNWAPDDGSLAPIERELLEASRSRESSEQRAAVRQTRRLRQLVAALTVLLLVAVASMVFAFVERNTAWQQRADALSGQVALRANSMQAADPALAAQLSLVAYRISPTAQARSSLLTTSGVPATTRLIGHSDGVTALSYGGNLLASASKDKTVRLWDATTRTSVATVQVPSAAYGVALSRDGKLLAAGIADGSIILWDVSTPRSPARLTVAKGHTDSVFALAFSPDGTRLASASGDKTVRLWRVDGRQVTSLFTLSGHEKTVTSIAYSPDGKLIASGSYDNTVRLWNTATGAPAGVLSGHTNAVTGVAFSPDSRRLASASYDESVRVWDPAGGLVSTFTGATSFLEAVAFSPDGRTVAAGGDDHITRLWDLAGGAQVATFTAPSTIRAVMFSPDGSSVATGAANWCVSVWDVRAAEVDGHAQSGWGMAFDKTGKVLASGHYDGTVRLWGTSDPRRPTALATLSGHTDPVTSVAFSPDGKTLASVSYDRTARLWDVADPAHARPLATIAASTGQLEAVVYDPSGKMIVTSGDDHL